MTGGGGRGCAPPPALHGLQLGFAVVHTCRRAACPGRVSPTTDEHKDCSRLRAGIAVRSLVWAEPPLTRGAGSHGGRGPGAASACSKHHRKLAPEWRAPSKETQVFKAPFPVAGGCSAGECVASRSLLHFGEARGPCFKPASSLSAATSRGLQPSPPPVTPSPADPSAAGRLEAPCRALGQPATRELALPEPAPCPPMSPASPRVPCIPCVPRVCPVSPCVPRGPKVRVAS